MATAFQREQQTDDFSIQSYNFGGLNTTASRLNVPFSDATELLNVNVGLDGSLLKRRGTKKLSNPPSGGVGYGVGVRSVLGYNFSIVAAGTDLTVYSRVNDSYTTERVFSGVYTSLTRAEPTQWVQLPDTYSRVLALRADRPPLEVYAVERRYNVIVNLSNQITVDKQITGDHKSLTPATFMDTIYLRRGDGTRVTYKGGTLTYTYNASTQLATVTLPFTSLNNESITYDVVGFRWCWWAESLKWLGDRFFDTLSRFNVTANDNNVAVPDALRSDVVLGEESLVTLICRTSNINDQYTFATQPTTADQYNLSDGSVYVPGASNYIQQAPYFITFGAARTPLPQPPESVKMLRFRELRFRQNKSAIAGNVRVTVNDTVKPVNYTGVSTGSSTPMLFQLNLTQATLTTHIARWIGFSGSFPVGVGATDVITVTNTELNGINGIQVEVEESTFQTGAYRRVYGLGSFSDYTQNIHPSVGCVYQGRLALSGISNDKSRVLISSIDPTEDRYSFFQITDDLGGLATDPFDVVVSGGDSADYIVGMVEWNSSLFTLTRRSVYRISGGDQPLTATRRLVTYISNIGLVNPRCIARTDTAVYYLSDGGVFNLTPRVEDSEFAAIEKSLKIRDLVLNRDTNRIVSSASMFFDSRQRKLYVSVPNSYDVNLESSDLLVLDTVREAWTTYETLGQFRVQSFYENVDNLSGRYSIVACCGGVGNLLLDYEARYTDGTTGYTGSTSYTHTMTMGYGIPSVADGQRYDIPEGIQVSGISSIQDLRVFVGTSSTPTEVPFTKYGKYVYLTLPTANNETVWFVVRSTVNDSPQGIQRYGAGNRYPYTLWSGNTSVSPSSEILTFNTVTRVVTLTVGWTGLTTEQFLIGTHYYTNYVSSMFTQQQLGTLKRTKHAYLYFNNGESSNYTVSPIVEAYTTRVNANVAMMYDSDDSDANTSVDIYGYQDIIWDNAYFDTVESSDRQDQYVLFKEPLIGIGYSYRLGVYSYDESRWNLVGYQIDASRNKGLRYISSD
jgi:hypothetical protein